jgi:hypothetical protein
MKPFAKKEQGRGDFSSQAKRIMVMPKTPPQGPVKRTAARVRGVSATAQAPAQTVSAPPLRADSVDARIAYMDQIVKAACQTPNGARDLLIRAGILTKKGTIRKKFL